MSITRAGDLLDRAQRMAWDLAYALPEAHEATLASARATVEHQIRRLYPHGVGSRGLGREETGWWVRRQDERELVPLPVALERRRIAAGVARGQLAAWPALAGAAVHALSAIPLDHAARGRTRYLRLPLDRLAGREVDGPPDDRLALMADLLGAYGDLLSTERVVGGESQDAVRALDRVLAAVETAATWTGAYLAAAARHDDPAWTWDLLRVAAFAHDALTYPPPDRGGALDDVAAVTRDDPSLVGVLTRWRLASIPAVQNASASPRGAQAVAADLVVLYGSCARIADLAAALDAMPANVAGPIRAACDQAQAAWRDAVTAWAPVVMGAPMDSDQVLASREFRTALGVLRDGAGWAGADAVRDALPELVTAVRHSLQDAEHVARAYTAGVDTVVARAELAVAARTLARSEQPVRLATMHAARLGRWLPLPPTSSPAQRLTDSADIALRATQAARGHVTVTARSRVEATSPAADLAAIRPSRREMPPPSMRGPRSPTGPPR